MLSQKTEKKKVMLNQLDKTYSYCHAVEAYELQLHLSDGYACITNKISLWTDAIYHNLNKRTEFRAPM